MGGLRDHIGLMRDTALMGLLERNRAVLSQYRRNVDSMLDIVKQLEHEANCRGLLQGGCSDPDCEDCKAEWNR